MRRRAGLLGTVGGAAGLVIAATASSLLTKLMYQLEGPALDGQWRNFEKPWFSTLLMFLGMALCLPLVPLVARMYRALEMGVRRVATGLELEAPLLLVLAAREPGQEPAGGQRQQQEAAGVRSCLLVLLPTAFDLTATLMMSVGLLYVTASTYAMVRGSEILFTAGLSVAFLRRRLNALHLAGLALCTVGIVTVGAASLLSSSGAEDSAQNTTAPQMLLGMALIVGAEAIQAAQVVAEDHFMQNLSLSPLTMVGFEGVWGTLLVGCLMLPLAQVAPGPEGCGLHEDTRETLAMLAGSPQLRAACLATVAVMGCYNIAGMLVTDNLGALSRTVLELSRTLAVWVANLALYYSSWGASAHGEHLGERWAGRASWLQAGGFGVMVLGTLCYARGEEQAQHALRAGARAHWEQARLLLAGRPPTQAVRIAGPARIRSTYRQRLFLDTLIQASRRASETLRGSTASLARLSGRSSLGAGEGERLLSEPGSRPESPAGL